MIRQFLGMTLGVGHQATRIPLVVVDEGVSVVVDFSEVEDTPDYVDSQLDAILVTGASDVVSGRLTPTSTGESSFKVKSTSLDLDGMTEIDIIFRAGDQTGITTAAQLQIFLCDSHTPGNLGISTPAGLTGYMITFGTNPVGIYRVIGGSDSANLSTATWEDPAGQDIRVNVVITGTEVTFKVYLNEILRTNGTVVDSDETRIDNFLSAGFCLRLASAQAGSIAGFEVDAV